MRACLWWRVVRFGVPAVGCWLVDYARAVGQATLDLSGPTAGRGGRRAVRWAAAAAAQVAAFWSLNALKVWATRRCHEFQVLGLTQGG
jgi:hypothetical protein